MTHDTASRFLRGRRCRELETGVGVLPASSIEEELRMSRNEVHQRSMGRVLEEAATGDDVLGIRNAAYGHPAIDAIPLRDSQVLVE